MKPGRYHIFLNKGAGWKRHFTWRSGLPAVVVPLAHYQASLWIRHPTRPGVYVAELTDKDGITLSNESPNIVVEISRELVDSLDFPETSYHLNLLGESQDFTLLQGQVHVDR